MTDLTRGPLVRIGVLQSTDLARLKANVPVRLVTETGQEMNQVPARTEFSLTILESRPAQMRHAIRLAKCAHQTEADATLKMLAEKKITAEAIRVGENIQFKQQQIDNREFWVITGEFANETEASRAAQNFIEFEDQSPVKYPLVPATGQIDLNGQRLGHVVRVVPTDFSDSRIAVSNILVGIEFHWERRETQEYRGVIEIRINNQGNLEIINELPVEDYLTSVNSSEMTPDCPMGLLKAQTIAARSTIFATMGKHHFGQAFHICADDHCQCYRGTTYEQATSVQAVNECCGETLMFAGLVCDARYAKICGGVMESFENVWENKKFPYMVSGVDGEIKIEYPLNTEEKARAYIDSSPDVYCNTDKYQLPKMLEYSNHLFRWKLKYSREELESIIRQKTGEDIGELQDIIPLERGDSGRLMYIHIVGSKKTLKIGKELAIRRALSTSHVYSSCFYVEKSMKAGKVNEVTLVGAGWGHGVGLCQVGATIMAQKGIPYPKILSHYYKQSELVKLY